MMASVCVATSSSWVSFSTNLSLSNHLWNVPICVLFHQPRKMVTVDNRTDYFTWPSLLPTSPLFTDWQLRRICLRRNSYCCIWVFTCLIREIIQSAFDTSVSTCHRVNTKRLAAQQVLDSNIDSIPRLSSSRCDKPTSVYFENKDLAQTGAGTESSPRKVPWEATRGIQKNEQVLLATMRKHDSAQIFFFPCKFSWNIACIICIRSMWRSPTTTRRSPQKNVAKTQIGCRRVWAANGSAFGNASLS